MNQLSRRDQTLKIVIPVYNEGANFTALYEEISLIRTPFEAFVIYDFDGDNTIPAVNRVIDRGDRRFHLHKNDSFPGAAGALLTGFHLAALGPVLVVMADLSDDLAQVDRMVQLYRDGYHLVAASRYSHGGSQIGGPFLKRTLSRCAGRSLHLLRGLPTSDSTNSFRLYDAEMLNALQLQSRSGFEITLEITVKAFLAAYRIAEVPATWHDRTNGESHFRFWKWLPSYLKWYFFAFRPRAFRRTKLAAAR
jgi:glycosyltransferase involved in cell wall biosynthesis